MGEKNNIHNALDEDQQAWFGEIEAATLSGGQISTPYVCQFLSIHITIF